VKNACWKWIEKRVCQGESRKWIEKRRKKKIQRLSRSLDGENKGGVNDGEDAREYIFASSVELVFWQSVGASIPEIALASQNEHTIVAM
jgi:hypothetical protein